MELTSTLQQTTIESTHEHERPPKSICTTQGHQLVQLLQECRFSEQLYHLGNKGDEC